MVHQLKSKKGKSVRFSLISLFVVVAILLGVNLGSNPGQAGAQDASMADHPIVGSWIMTDNGEASLLAFTSDGVVMDVESDRSPGLGAWEVTGPETARFTIAIQNISPEYGFEGTFIVRGEATSSSDGSSVAIDYSITGMLPDGTIAFDETGSGTAIPFPIEPINATGKPLAGYPLVSMEATPAS